MGTTDQLKLLLWKDFLVRRRHLSVATLVFGWAIAVFLVLYAVRESIDLEYSPTCQYTARNLPSTGLFPFVQSFICNVDNKCNNLSSYEEVPQYKNASCIKNIMYTSSAKCVWLSPQPTTLRGLCTQTTTKTQIILPFRLTGVAKQLEGAFTNETIISVVKSLPNMITLLKTVGAGLDSPNLEGIFGLGIKIRSLFENPNLLIREIKHTNPKLDAEVIDEIFESSLKVGHLFKSIGSTDIGSSICNPGELKKYLILQNPDNIEKVSAELCNISGDKVPSLLQNVFDHGDFTGLLDMVGKTVDNFMNYDMFLDLQKIVEIFLGLNFIKDIVPEYLKLHDWVPEIIPLMKNINKTHVDKDFVLQALEIIEPHFNETALWPKFKNLILHTTDLLIFYQNAILAKGPFKPLETSHTPTFQSFVNQLQTNIEKLKNPSEKDLTERQEVIIKIANDTINALPAFYLKSEKPWLHIANILDSITVIMDNNVFNVISTISYIYSQSILALENSLRHEYESEKIMYSLCEKHSNIVSTLFSLGPEFITNMLYCFGNITCTSIIVANKNNISQIFCDKNKTEEILPEASSVKNIGILCNIEMEPFIQDLIADFNLDWINKTITESEKRLNATNKLNDDSFTLAVENTERLFDFIQNRKNVEEKMDISWELLFPDFENTEWSNIANKARKHAGLYVVNVELSYLKESLKHKTHLNKYLNASSILMEGILSQYNLIPKSLLQSLLLHLPSVTETIIKIFANNTQRMMLESMDNWEHYFCNNDDENNVTMKIICEGIIYLNMQSNKPWFRHPLGLAFSTIIHNYVINGHEHRIINWDRFISNAQNVYLKISEIVSLRIPKYNWEEMEVFQSKYWFNWVQNLDITTEIRFGIQLVTKIGDIIEKNYFDPEYQEKWQEIQTTTSSVNHFLSFFLNIIDFAISSENNGPIVSNLYPETYKLSQIVIKNFDSLILDLEKFVNDKNTDFSKLANWFKHPCKKDISFILRQMTAESIVTLKAIQNGLCNVTKFEKEWKLAGVLSKQNKTSMIYGDEFQETTSKLIKILQEVHEINPGTTNLKMENLKQIETHLKTVHKETNFEKLIFSILDKILETSVMRQDTMRDLWNKLKHCLIQTDASCKNIESDTAHYSAKFVAVAVKEIATRMMQYLHLINGTEGVDPLRLIGFSNTSAIYTTYLKFPDFVKLLVYSYRSPEFENKIFEQRSIGKEVSCNEVLTNLIIPENNSVTKQDILALSRYVCPSFFDWPIMQDNLFLSTITKMQDIYLDVPVSKLDVSFVSVSNILFDLKTDILDMAKYGKFNIKQLWNKIWTEKVVDAYKDIKKLKFNSTNTLTRYFKYIDLPDSDLNISVNLVNPKFGFGDLTFFLQEITNALNNLKALNLSTAADAQEDIEQIQELTEFHSKEVASVLSYIYFKTSSSNFWNYFDEVCKDLTEEALIPLQIKKNKNVLEKLCSINNENVRNKLLPVEKLREIKNYNVNLEEIIIQFLTTLENFANNNDTIYLSSTITKYFDLGKIFNHSFPTDEQLRNSSLEKAQLLSDKPLEILSDVAESLSATTIVLKLLQGGDWWQTLLHNVEEPRIKFWLEILERIPTVILHISDAAVSPHLLYDITSNIVTKGYKIVCDDNFNLKKYIRDSNLVYIVKNACSRRGINDTGIQELYMNGTNIYFIYKQDKMAEIIYNFEKSLVDLVKQGPKPFYLPKWMNETEIVREYKDYAVQNSKPLKLLSTVTNVINEIIDIGSVFYKNNTNNCTWCNWATVLVREANKQLSQSQKYTDFLCNIPNMNIFEIRDTLTNDFKWGEFYEDIVNNKNSVEDFDMEIHDIVDVIKIQLITFYTNKTLQDLPEKCFSKIADSPALKNISTYISAIRELTKTFKNSSLQFFKNPLFTNITTNLSNAIETYIPILKPLESVLKEENNLTMDLKKMEINDDVIAELLSSKIDVNTLHRINNSEELGIYFTNRDYFNKLFSFINDSFARSIHNEFVFNDTTNLDNIFYDSIDENKLHKKIPKWRSEAAKSLNWVAKIFESLEKVIFNGGNILEFVANVDFGELSAGHFNISTMLRGILDLLEKNSIEKLFQSLRELIKSISPLIRNEIYENDLYELLDGVENMEIFRNLGLVRLKYNISDFIKDWKNVKQYLTQDLNLEESVVDNILNASIDLSEIISSQGNSMNIQSTVCDPKELLNIITFNSENVTKTAEEVSATLCNISMNEIRSLANVAFKHINLTRALSKIMNSTVNNILSSANMTEDEGKKIVKNIGVGADLLPYLKTIISNLSIDMNIFPKSEKLESNQKTKRSVVVCTKCFQNLLFCILGICLFLASDLLASVSTLLCGRPLIQSSNKLYKVISQAKDFNADKNDAIERNTLPTDFCVNIYKDVINMEIGKLIWAYVKPLLRGQILYTPDTPAVRTILKNANSTFAAIAELQDILFKITDSLIALEDREQIEHIFDNIQDFLNSSIVQTAVQSAMKSISNSNISIKDLNLKSMLNSFGNLEGITSALKFGSNFLRCVLLNRFVGVDTEEQLEQQAKILMRTNEFIAGIVFLNMDKSRQKRSVDLPNEISYKIRMDIDSVPSTSYMKYKFWTPDPESDFLEERYFRGFIQLQDLIDTAIIQLKAPKNLPKWETLTQEMPYPCWTKDFFKSALAVSQSFQVCFFFALIAVVAAAVRYIVWEKESGNTMVMNVMGLRYLTHCTSWFIVTFIEMLFAIICIFVILKVGGIITLSNSMLLFLYLLEFGFSVIMFCYMISSIFNSASLAAVGSAIFYLITYMPYIIIISLETTLDFWARLLTNFSMSSSFCYGCLYMIRFELQGVGLQWNNVWDTPIPGDSMSFGLTCIFLLIDSILYGLIGYICSKKSQGENYLDDTISSTNVVNDEPLRIGVTIKGLTKSYNSRKKTVKAIENIDITLYTGQVTTLLGHNGAGKTTLIKILTGMMQPTSGQIIINSEITENEKHKSKFLGVCPQGSVLINTMTPLEHLIFYAKLKTSRSTEEVMPEIVEMIDSMSLGRLSHEPVSHLSEGMRRRLCVAIAFIGKPKLVVLDEPSSGVDPVARRQIWDLVIRYKKGCTVLLTTHYLDEAELLSDRVVVLHKGKVLCSGSPLILRQSYGSGYKVTVNYPIEKEIHQINDTTVDATVSLVKKIASNAYLSEIRGFTFDITIPFNSTDGIPNNFENVASTLEDNQINLGFLNFNMNCATLEQVFLDLCERADVKENDLMNNSDTISQLGRSYSNIFNNSIEELPINKVNEVLIESGEKLTGKNSNKFFALLKKRAIHCMFDWRVIVCALVLPTVFTAIAMGFSLIRPPNSTEPPLKLTPELYQDHTTSFISVDTNDMESFINKVSREIVGLSPHKNLDMYTKSSRNCVCETGKQMCAKSSNPSYDSLLKLPSANDTVDWIIETQHEYIERRYGGWSLSDQLSNKSAMIVWYLNKGYHSMPSYLNTMNSAILRTVSPGSLITTYSHPLQLSVAQLSRSTIIQHIADVGIAMVLLIAFSLVPASGSIYLVQERVNEEKRMQFLSGVSPTLYWVVAFVWDLMVLLCSLLLAVIVFKIFGLPVYVARENLAAVSLLIFLYGWACIPFVHLTQRLFNDASIANMILFCICAFIGIAELICLLLMDILGKTQFVADLRDVLHSIYLIFPQFVLGDGLVEISKNNIQAEILERFHMDTYVSPLSWELMGVHYLSLALVGVILFVINLVLENEWLKASKEKNAVYPVKASCLEIVNLSKVYNSTSGKQVAVNDVSLNVSFGQCLGLIGVNGAGKSTTFKMLTTEIRPTSGRIFLQGREICRKPLYTGEMGYCPQSDSLDPKLTVRQTLKLYLTLRGIENKNEILNKIMSKFELTSYANRKNENLSGGNKRKVCMALSVLGKTSLILMDEPTSGMDPYSRNLVGFTIQQLIKQNRSVILTSHSVEDCEALCSNVAVMINGKIICEGSPQDLKERYGAGYIISVRLDKPTDQDLLLELMKKNFPGAEQMSRQYCSSQYAIPTDKTKISEMFHKMSKITQYASVEDFNLVQSSLDQVFINLANKSEATTSVNLETKPLPNMYCMDVIS